MMYTKMKMKMKTNTKTTDKNDLFPHLLRSIFGVPVLKVMPETKKTSLSCVGGQIPPTLPTF